MDNPVNRIPSTVPAEGAKKVVSGAQGILFFLLLAGFFAGAYLQPDNFFVWLNFLVMLFYLAFMFYKAFMVISPEAGKRGIVVTGEQLREIDDSQLPDYTILVPLYRETEVLSQLVRALTALDYPQDRKDIKLLLEEDDHETIAACREMAPVLPPCFEIVVVPKGVPRTKPRACNFGLASARGKFVVIYDAEDVPEPDQLKKSVAAFASAPGRIMCLQAKLNFYNQRQNILTRWFTLEYSMWFDLYLPALGAVDAPIPLGGTSNHFEAARLRELGGWDAYNVTEDCDLGVRLYRAGYRTAMLDSTTWEEACGRPGYWIAQRSRWVKGYIQTWLVHLRNPLLLLRQVGFKKNFHFHLVIGGMFFCLLVNPFYWLLSIFWIFTHWPLLAAFFPPVVFAMGAVSLFLGNFAFVYTSAAGAAHRRYYDLVKYAIIVPPYWFLMSLGAWRGLVQLIARPFYWDKTKHGFFKFQGVSPVSPGGGAVRARAQDTAEGNGLTAGKTREPMGISK